jgi:hypothetical protein
MNVVDEQVATCDPKLCAEAGRPHLHCSCGLPMAPGEAVCALCQMEELDPVEHPTRRVADDPLAWDGQSYPSRRQHRVGGGAVEAYEHLILMVLRAEAPENMPQATRRGRARKAASVPDAEAV